MSFIVNVGATGSIQAGMVELLSGPGITIGASGANMEISSVGFTGPTGSISSNQDICLLSRSATWGIPANLTTTLPYDTAEYDPSGMFAGTGLTGATGGARVVIGSTGPYTVSFASQLYSTSGSYIRLNGTTNLNLDINGGTIGSLPITRVFNTGDYLQQVHVNAATPRTGTIQAGVAPHFSVIRVG